MACPQVSLTHSTSHTLPFENLKQVGTRVGGDAAAAASTLVCVC